MGVISARVRQKYGYFLFNVWIYVLILATGYFIGHASRSGSHFENISIHNNVHLYSDKLPSNDTEPVSAFDQRVRLLCWILTSPDNLYNRAVHVKQTWGPRCDKTLYFSSVDDDSFPAIGLNVSEGRMHLTAKSHKAFRYIYRHFINQYDWYLKADDNTYVIVENLKYFLASKNTTMPVMYGHHFDYIIEGGYTSGGAGYVLSREALRRLSEFGEDKILCRQDGGSEDVEIGKCLHNLGVKVGNSYDLEEKSLFHCFDIAMHIFGNFPGWYLKYDAAGAQKGWESMSTYAISFHYVKWTSMYVYDYLLYHVNVNK